MPLIITINIPDEKRKCLEHVLDDIEGWANAALDGKADKGKERLVTEAIGVMRADPAIDTIPANDSQLIAEYTTRPDYKNRKQRETK